MCSLYWSHVDDVAKTPEDYKSFSHMNIIILLLCTFFAFISAANFDALDRRITLERSLLSNLNAFHAGVAVNFIPKYFDISSRPKEESKESSTLRLEDISFDIQRLIFSFLNMNDILQTRLVSPHFCNLSNVTNFMNLKSYNQYFVLKENWMNLVFSSFLFKYFENGRINSDDLIMVEHEIIFKKSQDELYNGKYSSSLSLLSFVHEYENGVGSSLPFTPADLFMNILTKSVNQKLHKSLEFMEEEISKLFFEINTFHEEQRFVLRNFFKQTIQLLISKPDEAAIMSHFRFTPNSPLDNTRLKILPYILRLASLDLILPLCHDEQQFNEVINMTNSDDIFPQILFKQLKLKFPHLVEEIFEGFCSILPAGFRAQYEFYPRPDIIGLDYLLTRNVANPFNLQELIDMKPDMYQLMFAFLKSNTMSLTEMDMLNQMKEAGLLDNLYNEEGLSVALHFTLSGEIRVNYYMAHIANSRRSMKII